MMKKATQQEAVAVTWVFWDIKMCPVPTGFHPRLVRPSIKRLLEKNGYGGPLTITAYGKLADVPIDMLREVFSSGIDLKIVPYGTIDIFDLMDTSHETNPPPANFMFISYGKACCGLSEVLEMEGYNPLQPFPIDSLESLLMEATNSGALDAETLESAFWDCCVCSCDPPSQCFESFVTHLSDEDHLEELMLVTRTPPPTALEDFPLVPLENPPFSRCHQDKLSKLPTISVPLQHLSAPLSEAPQINLEAVTLVFWDIKMCPVPRGCHPRRVGPCIKRFLKNKGYSGPLTITAIGVLKDVPNDVLEGVYSGGVSLNNICTGFSGTVARLICDFTSSNPPPANIMVISDAKSFTDSSRLESRGYNILRCDSLESFFLADSGALDDDKCSESAFWICSLCHMDLGGQGFDNYTTHVNSRRHQRELLLDDLPSNHRFTRAEPLKQR